MVALGVDILSGIARTVENFGNLAMRGEAEDHVLAHQEMLLLAHLHKCILPK